MPVTYCYNNSIVVLNLAGKCLLDDVCKTVRQSLGDPKCPPQRCLMMSLRESQGIKIRPSEEVKSIAQFVVSLSERFINRIGPVAPEDILYGLMRMASKGAEERGVRSESFREFDKARK